MAEKDALKNSIDINLDLVRQRIREACLRAGRDENEVTLIAVSKKKPSEAIEEAYACGARDFGENYVQELGEKQRAIEDSGSCPDIRWHMIGHLQKNKVKYLVGRVALIHAVDSVPLAEQIEKEAAKRGARVDILLEVNVAEEPSKYGFTVTSVGDGAKAISALPHVRLLGLMTSAPYTDDPEENRPYFRTLRHLADQLMEDGLIASADGSTRLPVLSMGMSNDYEIAVQEGATLVRVGTAIFGERK